MSQRAYVEGAPAPKARAIPSLLAWLGRTLQSIIPDPRKTQGYDVFRGIVQLSIEKRGVVGDVKRNACELLAFMTLAAPREGAPPPEYAPPLDWEKWGDLLNTSANNAQEAFAELQQDGVFASISGAEARQEGIKRPRGTHPGTRHFRLYVENWGNVEVSKVKPNVVPIAKPRVKAKAGEPLRLQFGQLSETLPVGAQVENYEFRFKDPGQQELDLELELAPPSVHGNVVRFELSVARKATSEEHIRLEPDLPRMSDGQARDRLILDFRQARDPRRKLLLTREEAERVVRAMGGSQNWDAFCEMASSRFEQELKATKGAITKRLLLWIAEDTRKHVRDAAQAERRQGRAS